MHRDMSRIEIYKSKYCLHILHTDTKILLKQNFALLSLLIKSICTLRAEANNNNHKRRSKAFSEITTINCYKLFTFKYHLGWYSHFSPPLIAWPYNCFNMESLFFLFCCNE